MRIVVFGAGGCVGGWICEELSQRHDVEVVACVRKWASAVRVARRGIDIRQVDLERGDDLSHVLAGASVVVNATMPAASVEPKLAKDLYLASIKAGARRFIQFSSAAIYGNRVGEVNETTKPAPDNDYARGKTEMENTLAQAAVNSDTQLFIFRPSIIYGPFSDGWTVRYVERIVRGKWQSLGRAGSGTCNLVHAHDVAKAVGAAAIEDVAPGMHILNLNGPDRISWNDYIERLGNAIGTHRSCNTEFGMVPRDVCNRGSHEDRRQGRFDSFVLSAFEWIGQNCDHKREGRHQSLSTIE